MSYMDLFGGILKNDKPFKLRVLKSDKSKVSVAKKQINRLLEEKRKTNEEINRLRAEIEIVQKKYTFLAEGNLVQHEQTAVLYLNGLVNKLRDSNFEEWEKDFLFEYIFDCINQLDYLNLISDSIKKIQEEVFQLRQQDYTEQEKNDMLLQFTSKYEKLLSDAQFPSSELQFDDISNDNFLENLVWRAKENGIQTLGTDTPIVQDNLNVSGEIKFKKLYKTLIKQVHPDVAFYAEEDLKKYTNRLITAWNNKDFIELLMVNHEINSEEELELDSDHLSIIENQLKFALKDIYNELEGIKASYDYYFYHHKFFHISEVIMDKQIHSFLNELKEKTDKLLSFYHEIICFDEVLKNHLQRQKHFYE